jgi:hypothetical protein
MTFDVLSLVTQETRGGWTALLLAFVCAAGSSDAQQVDTIAIDVSYLGASTDWCGADAGVPMVVKMDGPSIVQGPNVFPKKVIERRGSSVRVVDGANTSSFQRPENMPAPDAEVIGRFSAEFQSCLSVFGSRVSTGTWLITNSDGAKVESGAIDDASSAINYPPFFNRSTGSSDALYAQFGDRFLFAKGVPNVTVTQIFLADPDKEQ